jgi:hypothetical protein
MHQTDEHTNKLAAHLEKLKERAHFSLDCAYEDLQERALCSEAFAEFVRYFVAYIAADETRDFRDADTNIGRELFMFITEICEDNGMADDIDHPTKWVFCLNQFAGNYFFDDNCFRFRQDSYGVFSFYSDVDYGYTNPRILVEAAKANVEWKKARKSLGWLTEAAKAIKVDGSKVLELAKNEHTR